MKFLFVRQYLHGDGDDPTKRDIWFLYDKDNFFILTMLKFLYNDEQIFGYKCVRSKYIHRQINDMFYKIRDDPLTRKIKCDCGRDHHKYKKEWETVYEQIKNKMISVTTLIEPNFLGEQVELMCLDDYPIILE